MTEIIATINQGRLRGKSDKDVKGTEFFSFLGIPYAKPPVGKLRFMDPEPPESWDGERDATSDGSSCFSLDLSPTAMGALESKLCGSEDCLFLNVFTHQLRKKSGTLKPVMVFIHGGAFTVGSSTTAMFGPRYLMMEDIVLVTINYRIGSLGFVSLSDLNVANAGMKDMVQALKWIKENIKEFGGDPENVTIFGISAGSAAVHYLILSPLAKGLFHKAIAQSGTATNVWARGEPHNGLALAKVLGCQDVDEKDVLKFLQEQPAEKILEGQFKLDDHFDASKVRYFSPVIENPSAKAFISVEPRELIFSGNYNKVPLIMGYASHEGILIHMLSPIKISVSLENSVPVFLHKGDQVLVEKTNKEINQFYFGKNEFDSDNLEGKYNLATDSFFLREVYDSIRGHVKTSLQPVYFYKMTIETEVNFLKKMMNIPVAGVAHGEDIGYLFSNSMRPDFAPDSAEDIGIRRFVKMWANFAKTGAPIPSKDSLLNVDWEPCKDGKMNCLEIGRELKAVTDPDIERIVFWDKIFSNV